MQKKANCQLPLKCNTSYCLYGKEMLTSFEQDNVKILGPLWTG